MRRFTAKWIWPTSAWRSGAHVLFRKDVYFETSPGALTLFMSAGTFAKLYVNGREIHCTSSISYPQQQYYETAEIGEAFHDGLNQIAVLAWYIGIPSGSDWPKDPGVLVEMVNDAGEMVIGTNATWLAKEMPAWRPAPRRAQWLNLDWMEIVDHRLLGADFPMVQFLEDFEAPAEKKWPGIRHPTVEPRPFAKCIRGNSEIFFPVQAGWADTCTEYAEHPGRAISHEVIQTQAALPETMERFTVPPTPDGQTYVILMKMDGYRKGYYSFIADAPEGAMVDITWEEQLRDDRIDLEATRIYTTDRHILAEGENVIFPEEWKAGRYLQLNFRNVSRPLAVRKLCWIPENYPLERKAEFTSSDKRLEKIWDISLNAAAMCMHDNIMDCPWREKRQWIGDVQRIALINHYSFGEKDLIRGVLRQHARLQDISGRIWVCQPLQEEYPGQTMEWLRAVMEYQQYTGDKTLVEELTPVIRRLGEWFAAQRDENELFKIDTPNVMNWMDTSFGSTLNNTWGIGRYRDETALLVMNLRYLLFLDDLAAVMEQAEDIQSVNLVRRERSRLAEQIVKVFYQESEGLLRDCARKDIPVSFSEMGHALAVLAELPGLDGESLWDRFCGYREKQPENVYLPTPFGKYQTLEALGKLGRQEDIIREIFEWWGPMVDAGSDTTWEGFNEPHRSQCHGWAGVPVVALMRYVFKVEPGENAPKKAENIAGIEWMQWRAVK